MVSLHLQWISFSGQIESWVSSSVKRKGDLQKIHWMLRKGHVVCWWLSSSDLKRMVLQSGQGKEVKVQFSKWEFKFS